MQNEILISYAVVVIIVLTLVLLKWGYFFPNNYEYTREMNILFIQLKHFVRKRIRDIEKKNIYLKTNRDL